MILVFLKSINENELEERNIWTVAASLLIPLLDVIKDNMGFYFPNESIPD
jgi:hypothetical protein